MGAMWRATERIVNGVGYLDIVGRINSTPEFTEGGHGLSVTNPGTGIYELRPDAKAAALVAALATLEADIPPNVVGHTVVAYSSELATNGFIELVLYNAAGVTRNLGSGEWINFQITLRLSSVT